MFHRRTLVVEVVQTDTNSHVNPFTMTLLHPCLSMYSAHSDRRENYLAIANLHNGIDIYILPTMQLVKTYTHGSVDTMLYQVAFTEKDWVISGSEEGHACIYERSSGVLRQKLDHCQGTCVVNIDYGRLTCMQPRESVAYDNRKAFLVALIWILISCSFHQSHGGPDGTLVVTATSIIKVWHVALGNEHTGTSTTVKSCKSGMGITPSQLIWILIITSLANIALSRFDIIGPILGPVVLVLSPVHP